MEIYFDQSYSLLLILLCLLSAGLISYFVYRGKQQQAIFSSFQLKLLIGLRFIAFFLIAFLLLGAAIQRFKHNKFKPLLIFAIDNSQSLQNFQPQADEILNQARKQLQDFEVEFWTFGEKAQQNSTITFNENRSDYSELLQSISLNYMPSGIGGLVILGDGVYNSGNDPVYESRSLPYPIYTVGIGDTTIRMDAAIRNIKTNQTTFLNNYFPVEIDLSFSKADGKTTNLSVLKDDKTVYEKSITIYGDQYFQQETIRLKAEASGMNNYSVLLENLPNEDNTINNQSDFTINVTSQKQKILFLTHGSHPDLSAIIQTIENSDSYEWDILSVSESPISYSNYSLVIAHQLPDDTRESIQAFESLQKSKCPYLLIISSGTSLPILNNLQTGIDIQQTKTQENAEPVLNKNFTLFALDENLEETIKNWPPLNVPFGEITPNQELQTLMSQQVQTIQTGYPLISLGRINGVKRGFIIGEGIWRWRLYNYLQDGSHQAIDELIQKTINYLILKLNEDNFNVYFQTEYAEDSPVLMQAELLNDSYEPVNEPEVSMELVSDDNKSYSFIFDKTDDQYELDMGNIPSGTYSFEAKTKLGENEYTETGSFLVTKLQIEQAVSSANFQPLYQMSANTGGEFFDINNWNRLKDTLTENEQLKEQKVKQLAYQEFISIKWLFFLILTIMSLEWFLRKFWGSY